MKESKSSKVVNPYRRTHMIGFRCDDLEFDEITQLAQERRMSRTSLLRWGWGLCLKEIENETKNKNKTLASS